MKKIAIIYGACETGIQQKAIETLTRELLDYTVEYPTCIAADAEINRELFHQYIYIGTKENNPYLAKLDKHPTAPEGYVITVKDDTVYIEGTDDAGVLYGCVDFYAKYITKAEYTNKSQPYWKNPFEDGFVLPDFELASAPSITKRGLWTWGHVIYDYRRYIDNMVKLKMNTVIIWNDFVPVNIKEIIEYAHNSHVEVILGYSWGWSQKCDASDMNALAQLTEEILAQYERDFAHLDIDGIYFQSFTETTHKTIGGRLIAEAVTELVNTTADRLLAKHPGLELQFGLHATSVNDKLEYIKKTDPRVRIVWEDCGSFPFAYRPTDFADKYEETKVLTRDIATLRGADERFGVVTKSFTTLWWGKYFEHQRGSYFMGVSSDAMKTNRIVRKHKEWKYLQANWMCNCEKAYEIIRLMKECTGGDFYCTALVEDGMFEEEILYHVALYGEMLWNTDADLDTMMTEVALRDDVTFA